MVYLFLKFIHVLAVIVFTGNIIVGIFWKSYAEKQHDRLRIGDVFKGIIKADRVFTMPGAAVLLVFGLGAALHGGYDLFETKWIFYSIILYVISAAAFMAKVVPVQKQIVKLCEDEAQYTWEKYKILAADWMMWGGIALLPVILATLLMVLKVPY